LARELLVQIITP